MNTATKIELLDALHEALNGLTVGWQCANYPDAALRAERQAPINAAKAEVLKAIEIVETLSLADGDARRVSRAIYGKADTIGTPIIQAAQG